MWVVKENSVQDYSNQEARKHILKPPPVQQWVTVTNLRLWSTSQRQESLLQPPQGQSTVPERHSPCVGVSPARWQCVPSMSPAWWQRPRPGWQCPSPECPPSRSAGSGGSSRASSTRTWALQTAAPALHPGAPAPSPGEILPFCQASTFRKTVNEEVGWELITMWIPSIFNSITSLFLNHLFLLNQTLNWQS